MDVSVIIPIYKGNGYIESLLNKIEKNYQESQKEIEVIFVNDYPDEEIIVGSQHDFPIRIINNAGKINEPERIFEKGFT